MRFGSSSRGISGRICLPASAAPSLIDRIRMTSSALLRIRKLIGNLDRVFAVVKQTLRASCRACITLPSSISDLAGTMSSLTTSPSSPQPDQPSPPVVETVVTTQYPAITPRIRVTPAAKPPNGSGDIPQAQAQPYTHTTRPADANDDANPARCWPRKRAPLDHGPWYTKTGRKSHLCKATAGPDLSVDFDFEDSRGISSWVPQLGGLYER
jgi:hypothetical protein